MTLREIIVNEFINDPWRFKTVYQTNQSELFRMYDKMVEAIKKGEDFKRFLAFEGATTAEGKIRYDRESMYIDPEDKKKVAIKTKVVFKYPVYNYFYWKYTEALADIKEKESKIPLPVNP